MHRRKNLRNETVKQWRWERKNWHKLLLNRMLHAQQFICYNCNRHIWMLRNFSISCCSFLKALASTVLSFIFHCWCWFMRFLIFQRISHFSLFLVRFLLFFLVFVLFYSEEVGNLSESFYCVNFSSLVKKTLKKRWKQFIRG